MADRLNDQLRVFVVPVDIMEIPDLSIHEQMTYIVLRSFANAHSSTAFPSYATIARLGRMTRRHAINCVGVLIKKGLLTKEEQFKVTKEKKIRQSSNIYTIESPRVVNGIHQGSEYHSPGVVNTIHQGSEYHSPEQSTLTKQIEQKKLTTTESLVVDPFQSQKSAIQKALHGIGVKIQNKEIDSWLEKHELGYILEKITILRNAKNKPSLRALRAAIRDDWQPNDTKGSSTQKNAPERQFGAQKTSSTAYVQPGKYERFYEMFEKAKQHV